MAGEPPVKYAMGFIDGQNLFQHAMAAFGHIHPNYDPKTLHGAVCAANGWKPNAVRFYTGVPDQKHSPMWASYWSNRIIAMNRAGVITTTRPLRYREKEVVNDGKAEIISVAQEKGIDVRLALDIISCALSDQFNVAVIYSQDQDLCEVVHDIKKIALKTGKAIELACAFPVSATATSRRGIAGVPWFKMDEAFYNACLDPNDYRPKRGA
jgi:hypothetical protein